VKEGMAEIIMAIQKEQPFWCSFFAYIASYACKAISYNGQNQAVESALYWGGSVEDFLNTFVLVIPH
jgi:hypothetical protein